MCGSPHGCVGPFRLYFQKIFLYSSLHFSFQLTLELRLRGPSVGQRQLLLGFGSISVIGSSPVQSSVSDGPGDSCAVNFRVCACHLPSGGGAARLWSRWSSPSVEVTRWRYDRSIASRCDNVYTFIMPWLLADMFRTWYRGRGSVSVIVPMEHSAGLFQTLVSLKYPTARDLNAIYVAP